MGAKRVLVAALVLYVAIFGFRLAVDDPTEPVLFFLVIPIGLIAAETGPLGGLGAAAAATLMVGGWDLTTESDLTPYGYFARGSLFVLSGLTVGSLSASRREVQVQNTHWFEHSPDLNCVVDLDGNFVRVNQAWSDSLGYPASDLLGRSFIEFVHPDDAEKTAALASRWEEDQDVSIRFENRYRRADGSFIWLRWTSEADRARGLIYATAHDVTAMKELEEQLRSLSQTDPLTGLSNRRHFEEEAGRQLNFIARYGHRGALFVLDIDRFKEINDASGHGAGDAALVTFASAIKARIRQVDLVGRIGGDEFAILFPEVGPNEARLLAMGLRDSIHQVSATITSSMGIALFEATGRLDLVSLITCADKAMYVTKRAGGDGFTLGRLDEDVGATWSERNPTP